MNESSPPFDEPIDAQGLGPGAESAVSMGKVATCVALTAVAFLVAFWPEFRWLSGIWINQPDYSHGLLVVPLALVILWRRFEVGTDESLPWHPVWLGWLGLAVVLGARAYLHQRGSEWAAASMMLAALPCLVLTLGGWELMGRVWPALAFLVFMYPLPTQLDARLSRPLQQLATTASVNLMKNVGFWVMAEGNVIHVGANQLEVATACNGLAMLMCLAATVTAVVILMPLRSWQRLLLLVSVIPVALLCNVLRIVATAYAYRELGPERAGHLAHDVAGWLMMPLALVIVGLEIAALRWLVVEEHSVEEPLILGKPLPRKRVESVVVDDESPPPLGLPVPAGGERGDEHE